MKYAITCLPRSRSAFFSAYLSHGGSFCLHDAFYGLESLDDFPRLFTEYPKADGVSDPALVLHWEKVVNWFPDAKWVVIERPFEEVVRSCEKICSIDRKQIWEFSDKLGRLIAEVNPMMVDFHSITPQVAMDIAEYCGVDAGGIHRAELMCRMNIQLDPSYLKEALVKVTANPPEWMSK